MTDKIFKVEEMTNLGGDKPGVKFSVRNAKKERGELTVYLEQVEGVEVDDTGLMYLMTNKATVNLQFSSVRGAEEIARFLNGYHDYGKEGSTRKEPSPAIKCFKVDEASGFVYCLTESKQLWRLNGIGQWTHLQIGVDEDDVFS